VARADLAARRRIVGGVVSLGGVCPVLASPFDERGAVDTEGFGQLVAHVLDSGVGCVMWPGFASEFYKLSDEETGSLRACLLERARARGCLAIISVSRHATRLAVGDAVAAAEAGAHALNVLPPYFLSPSREAVLEHLRAVLSAVAPVPVIVQHAPGLAPSAIDATDLTSLAARHRNLRMVKVDSASAYPVIGALLAGQPPLDVTVGYAGITMIESLRQGASGVQPGCSFVEVYQRIWRLWEEGRPAEAAGLHDRLRPYLTRWMAELELMIQVEKTISKRRGWIASDHCRAPGRRLTAEESSAISRFLDEFADLLASPGDGGSGKVG
jgi:dihydrodipicolinate synthase/N-acetylneuraminate lyase